MRSICACDKINTRNQPTKLIENEKSVVGKETQYGLITSSIHWKQTQDHLYAMIAAYTMSFIIFPQ